MNQQNVSKEVRVKLVVTFAPDMQDFYLQNKMGVRDKIAFPRLVNYAEKHGLITRDVMFNDLIAYDKTMPRDTKCHRCEQPIGTMENSRVRWAVLNPDGKKMKNADGSDKERGQATILKKDGVPFIADFHPFCQSTFELPDGAEWMSHIQAQRRLGGMLEKQRTEAALAKEKAKADEKAKAEAKKEQAKLDTVTAELATQLAEAGMLNEPPAETPTPKPENTKAPRKRAPRKPAMRATA